LSGVKKTPENLPFLPPTLRQERRGGRCGRRGVPASDDCDTMFGGSRGNNGTFFLPYCS
jgi:hypothetical protein